MKTSLYRAAGLTGLAVFVLVSCECRSALTGDLLTQDKMNEPTTDFHRIETLPQSHPDSRCAQSTVPRKPITFRSSVIMYYGPHCCENCGVMICKMGREFGGNSFVYPEGPIYPNTEWNPHVCDPKAVASLPSA